MSDVEIFDWIPNFRHVFLSGDLADFFVVPTEPSSSSTCLFVSFPVANRFDGFFERLRLLLQIRLPRLRHGKDPIRIDLSIFSVLFK